MALKPDRHELVTDVSFYMNETAERGLIVTHSTAGSGAAMDDANALVAIAATASGTDPAGLLLNDVVNIDLTRQHINWHQDEVQQGGKVTLLKQGWVVTNSIDSASANQPTVGAPAYYTSSGLLSTANPMSPTNQGADVDHNRQLVGRFLSTMDADGYAKVYININ
jgi:hypothetical protein